MIGTCVAKMPGVIRCGCPTCSPPVKPQRPLELWKATICTVCKENYPYADPPSWPPFVCRSCKSYRDL